MPISTGFFLGTRIPRTGEFRLSADLQGRWIHGEPCGDLGADLDALGFEVEGFWVLGFGVRRGAGEADGVAVEGGTGPGAACRGVREFEEGGDGGVECFGVFPGALDGVVDGVAAGGAVGR